MLSVRVKKSWVNREAAQTAAAGEQGTGTEENPCEERTPGALDRGTQNKSRGVQGTSRIH